MQHTRHYVNAATQPRNK